MPRASRATATATTARCGAITTTGSPSTRCARTPRSRSIFNQLRQPETQDPLGLSRAQVEDNPRQATPQAIQFNTRKTIFQEQLGATLEHQLSSVSKIQATVYGGNRWVEQYLAIPLAAQAAPTSSGGVVQLDRQYTGGALRFSTGEIVRFSVGVEYDLMEERRRGFINNLGTAGALKRDEDDEVSATDLYAQLEWRFAERWSVHGGLRASRVEFKSTDHFIAPGNPDDSGTRTYSETTPVAGLLFRYSKTTSFYGSYGEGFETPTFAELAHQNPPATGLNFALEASRSKHAEAGVKTIFPQVARVNAAVFAIETRDEIVVDVASGGRTTFRNAGRTERQGFEIGAETLLRGPFSAQFAYTYLDATFKEGFAIPRGQRAARRAEEPGLCAAAAIGSRGSIPTSRPCTARACRSTMQIPSSPMLIPFSTWSVPWCSRAPAGGSANTYAWITSPTATTSVP